MGCTVSLRHSLQQVAGPIGTNSPVRVSLIRRTTKRGHHSPAQCAAAALLQPMLVRVWRCCFQQPPFSYMQHHNLCSKPGQHANLTLGHLSGLVRSLPSQPTSTKYTGQAVSVRIWGKAAHLDCQEYLVS